MTNMDLITTAAQIYVYLSCRLQYVCMQHVHVKRATRLCHSKFDTHGEGTYSVPTYSLKIILKRQRVALNFSAPD